jgi:uncharacterized membrane protein
MLLIKSKKIKIILLSFFVLAIIGAIDSLYLTKKHYTQEYTCSLLEINNCESVLSSSYSTIFNIPIALIGFIYYLLILINALIYFKKPNQFSKNILSYIPTFSFIFSAYLVYLQLFVLRSICQYCMLSAATSTIIFILSIILIKNKTEKQEIIEQENK